MNYDIKHLIFYFHRLSVKYFDVNNSYGHILKEISLHLTYKGKDSRLYCYF